MMNKEQATIIALQALTYLIGDEKGLQRFFYLSGVESADLYQRANDLEFLAGVLDFFLTDETRLFEMCQSVDIAPDMPGKARLALPGGKGDDWS